MPSITIPATTMSVASPLRTPSLSLVGGLFPLVVVRNHPTATDFSLATEAHLQRNQYDANMVLPYVMEERSVEGGREAPTVGDSDVWWRRQLRKQTLHALSPHSPMTEAAISNVPPTTTSSSPYFISLWTLKGSNRQLDIALTCVGVKPVFLYASQWINNCTDMELDQRVNLLAARMKDVIPWRRVFSIFGPTRLTNALAKRWSELTGIKTIQEPFYHCFYTFCTRSTFESARQLEKARQMNRPLRQRRASLTARWVGLANLSHLEKAAVLLKDFADDSVIFPLELPAAKQEGIHLIKKRQLYVYEVENPETGDTEIASIVAVTRQTRDVAAISKVFTAESMRGRGYAELLVAHVCDEILKQKERLVLFVGHHKDAARVYAKCGFVGVAGLPEHKEVEDWIELGLEGAELGHW